MPSNREFESRLEVEEAEMRAVLQSLRRSPLALHALRAECERLVEHAENRWAECRAAADQVVGIAMREAEEADHEVKIAHRLLEMAKAPS